ncbi:SusE domain-containing protein [[Flexibacter] sp. ATCC 35208]|uniref:SusE domain-containing protein n=1 Tax=[Flexibacter] sp. ATCC 35208 TaxID=1936242 RepID=UPI0009D53725|nr:SusE domain-containing protein [[Flexibacter] sp. ATCC 35208]OMP80182.1 hypothetical protein BW716_05075 [[Flexibacter] sp. ATCC 35208]
MKFRFNYIYILSFSMLTLFSCKKDGSFTQVKSGTTPGFTATDSVFVFTEADAASAAVTYNWTASEDWGYKSIVTYYLQIDEKGNGFKNATDVTIGTGILTKAYTVAGLNQVINNMGLAAGRQHDLVIRVKAAVDEVGDEVYSDSISLTVTPYYVPKVYTYLYLPGAYEGWSFDNAGLDSVASVNNDGNYEGYMYLTGSTEFKVTTAKSWDVNYGDGGSGSLSSSGGNIAVSAAGYYRLTVDINQLTYTMTNTTWSIYGSALGSADAAMTFNAGTGAWTVTTTLSAGTFYFRANSADAITLSDVSNNGTLASGTTGAITVDAAGTYTISMNLSNPGNYTYSLTAQ